jgi:hypothetical protein
MASEGHCLGSVLGEVMWDLRWARFYWDYLFPLPILIPPSNYKVQQNNGKPKDTVHFPFSNVVLYHLVPSVQRQPRTSSEQSLVELCTIPSEHHLQIALEVLKVGICFSSIQYRSTRVLPFQ